MQIYLKNTLSEGGGYCEKSGVVGGDTVCYGIYLFIFIRFFICADNRSVAFGFGNCLRHIGSQAPLR